jgi:signal transduction histidine kinase
MSSHSGDDHQDPPDVLRRREQQLVALGRSALASDDAARIARECAEVAALELEVALCRVYALASNDALQLLAAAGRIAADQPPVISLADYAPAATALRTQEQVVLGADRREWRAPDIAQVAIVPLIGTLLPLGILEVHTVERAAFSTDELTFLQILAHLLAGALQRISLMQPKQDQKMRRAEQMMAIGQVAAGVAHELRNPLTSIKGLVQVNLREAKRQGLPADDLAVIEHEIRRMERTLQTFLDFARPPQPNRQALLLEEIVFRVFALVSGRARKQSVALEHQLQPGVWVLADADQIQQLLLNLVLNALDALPGGGTIAVEVSQDDDQHVELSVRDTGPGIAPHILPKVFETFVSSKETGVGLGLPVSQRIAVDHGGTLSAYNSPGGGACFVLRLPAAP